MLTLVVFRSGKPSLCFDLGVIALLQVSALAYGVWVSAQSRPVYLTLLPQRARIIHANQVVEPPEQGRLTRTLWLGAEAVVTVLPDDTRARSGLLWSVMSGASDIDYRPRYYTPLADVQNLATDGSDLGQFAATLPDHGTALREWLRRRSAPPLMHCIPCHC